MPKPIIAEARKASILQTFVADPNADICPSFTMKFVSGILFKLTESLPISTSWKYQLLSDVYDQVNICLIHFYKRHFDEGA